MRIIALSDIHDDIDNLDKLIQKNIFQYFDLIIIAGDLSNGDPSKVIKKLKEMNIDIIIVRGNHDPLDMSDLTSIIELKYGEMIEYKGIKIMGHPYPTEDHNITGPSEDIKYFEKLDHKMRPDIIISHAPPYGINDQLDNNPIHYGSKALLKYIKLTNPLLVVCGHVHDSSGKISKINNTDIVNVSIFNGLNPKGCSWMEINFTNFIYKRNSFEIN